MDEIKSALEIALEKAKGITVSEKEIEKDTALEQGTKLAGEYLRNPKFNLSAKLTEIKEKLQIIHPDVSSGQANYRLQIEGAIQVFLRNIILPENKERKKENLRAMEGLYHLKKDKEKLKDIFAQIDQFFDEYLEHRKQLYEHLRKKYESFIRQTQEMKNLEEQMKKQGVKLKIAVEQNPQFQQEWRAILNQLDQDYGTQLQSVKEQLSAMKNID
ncbi:MAG TPA: hypothetical protein DHV62_03075 [Elusimicrobia bacterium]|jgi:ElaB/YqjD/DUF883 family membrane-anchored ribosome-binding protein|nr:hypothetical protein [Elusimicrobiota bacterium]